MATINYENLKEVVSREELIIREEIEVDDLGNFCVRAYNTKQQAEYLAINTDESGFMTIITVKSGSITWKTKDHYDINLIISTAQTFLKNHPTVLVITKKDFKNVLQATLDRNLNLTMRDTDKEAEEVLSDVEL